MLDLASKLIFDPLATIFRNEFHSFNSNHMKIGDNSYFWSIFNLAQVYFWSTVEKILGLKVDQNIALIWPECQFWVRISLSLSNLANN